MSFNLSPTDFVRKSLKLVAGEARSVSIRHDRLNEYAAKLPDRAPPNVFDPSQHFIGEDEETAAFVLALGSINFGSGYKDHMKAEGTVFEQGSLYYRLSLGLKALFERGEGLTATDMSRMSSERIGEIFTLNPANGSYTREFVTMCARMMGETGRFVGAAFGGGFTNLIDAAEGSVDKMIAQLLNVSHFRDEQNWKGQTIALYKRVQITTAYLHLAFGRKGRSLFSDIDRLTMFADNAVPHVLRTDGILDYADDLAARIDAGEDIPSGSEEEIEIRACAGHAVELIAQIKSMPAMTIDHILWHRSEEDDRYRSTKTHKTVTENY